MTHALGEGPPRDPALLESAEVFYTLIRRSAAYRFYHMGTLVLHVQCEGEKGT